MRFSFTTLAVIAVAAFTIDAAVIPHRRSLNTGTKSVEARAAEVEAAKVAIARDIPAGTVVAYKRSHPRDFRRAHRASEAEAAKREEVKRAESVVARDDKPQHAKRMHARDFRARK